MDVNINRSVFQEFKLVLTDSLKQCSGSDYARICNCLVPKIRIRNYQYKDQELVQVISIYPFPILGDFVMGRSGSGIYISIADPDPSGHFTADPWECRIRNTGQNTYVNYITSY